MNTDRHIMAIDLGTSKIAVTVAKIDGRNIEITYHKETPSRGIKYSRVYNPARASEAISTAIKEAENALGISCKQVVVGLPKYEVRQEAGCMSVDRNEDECLTLEDIQDLKKLAIDSYELQNPDKETLFGAVAQSFNADSEFQVVEDDIIGMTMAKLEGNFKLFVGQSKSVNDIDRAFQQTGEICVSRKYFTPDAIAKAVLYDEEMDSGVALIDLGAGVTSVSIYSGNIMRHYSSIPYGGAAITNDIKNVCGIGERLAENIKLAYGACIPDRLGNLAEKTLQISSNSALQSKQLTAKYLSEIITARASEIIEAILYEIQKSGFASSLRKGVVITGGGANLANIGTLLHEISGYTVRIGNPKAELYSSDETFEPASAASIGMILMAKNEKGLNCVLPKVDEVEVDEDEPENSTEGTVFDNTPVEQPTKPKTEKPKKVNTDKPSLAQVWSHRVGDLFEQLSNEQA